MTVSSSFEKFFNFVIIFSSDAYTSIFQVKVIFLLELGTFYIGG